MMVVVANGLGFERRKAGGVKEPGENGGNSGGRERERESERWEENGGSGSSSGIRLEE